MGGSEGGGMRHACGDVRSGYALYLLRTKRFCSVWTRTGQRESISVTYVSSAVSKMPLFRQPGPSRGILGMQHSEVFRLSWKIKQKCQKMDPRPKSEFRPRFCLPNVVVWAPHPGESSGWLGPSDKDLRRALEKFPDLSVKLTDRSSTESYGTNHRNLRPRLVLSLDHTRLGTRLRAWMHTIGQPGQRGAASVVSTRLCCLVSPQHHESDAAQRDTSTRLRAFGQPGPSRGILGIAQRGLKTGDTCVETRWAAPGIPRDCTGQRAATLKRRRRGAIKQLEKFSDLST